MLNRRAFLRTGAAGLLGSLAASRLAFAAAPTDNRFVFVFLRGGLDGLHALAPFADADYHRLRPGLALQADQVLSLDGYFGMHPALAPLMPLWQDGTLGFVPAAATGYRERSHFDGQNMLENGSGQPFGARDGWLNRAILGLNGGDRRLGLALGPAVPLILQGPAHVQAWVDEQLPDLDEDFLARLAQVYQADPLFAAALGDARGAPEPDMGMGAAGAQGDRRAFSVAARAAGDLLARADGPRIAVMELQGWDTHTGQAWRLERMLETLADGLRTLADRLGPAWAQTVVMVGSEFGRTAAQNGSGGTDHGTGGLAMLAGGAVRGGRIAGRWPGLNDAALFEDRDVLAANAYEGIFKAILIRHLGLTPAFVEAAVFPDSRAIAPMEGLLR